MSEEGETSVVAQMEAMKAVLEALPERMDPGARNSEGALQLHLEEQRRKVPRLPLNAPQRGARRNPWYRDLKKQEEKTVLERWLQEQCLAKDF